MSSLSLTIDLWLLLNTLLIRLRPMYVSHPPPTPDRSSIDLLAPCIASVLTKDDHPGELHDGVANAVAALLLGINVIGWSGTNYSWRVAIALAEVESTDREKMVELFGAQMVYRSRTLLNGRSDGTARPDQAVLCPKKGRLVVVVCQTAHLAEHLAKCAVERNVRTVVVTHDTMISQELEPLHLSGSGGVRLLCTTPERLAHDRLAGVLADLSVYELVKAIIIDDATSHIASSAGEHSHAMLVGVARLRSEAVLPVAALSHVWERRYQTNELIEILQLPLPNVVDMSVDPINDVKHIELHVHRRHNHLSNQVLELVQAAFQESSLPDAHALVFCANSHERRELFFALNR